MEIFRINIKPQTEIDRHLAFTRSLHDCPICETGLDLEVLPVPGADQVIETASCKKCEVEMRTEIHSIH